MVQYIDLDGNLTKALNALREVRRRCLSEGWGAPTLAEAMALMVVIDQGVARQAGCLKEWNEAWERGEEIAEAALTEIPTKDLAKGWE